jgi:glycosyltransferase involved in cell wall biosynthesis
MMRRVDVVHFQWLDEPIYDYYFMQLLKLFGFKIVYTAHNIVPHEVISGEDLLFGKIYSLVDRVIVHAANNKKEMIDHFGLRAEKICVVPHGAYTLFFRHLSITKEAARDQLGLPRDKRIILFFGAIRQYKGLELLVEAFKLVREREATSTLLVVGDVPPVDPESVARYSRLMAELANVDHIVCRKGYVDFHSVSRYFLACDVVVLPYVKTYQSGVLMVACAAGRPAIVTNTGGLAEVLDQGQSGIVVPPGKVEDLAEAILFLVSDPKRAEVMGRHALRLSQSVYSWESVARQTLVVYESLISKRVGQEVAADCEYD